MKKPLDVTDGNARRRQLRRRSGEPPETDASPLQTTAWLLEISQVALVVKRRRRSRDIDAQ